jgi:hypothetical protein
MTFKSLTKDVGRVLRCGPKEWIMAAGSMVSGGGMLSRRAVVGASVIGFVDQAVRAEAAAMKHLVLFGDSVFDNARYVSGGPDVQHQVADLLPEGSQITLLAQDGALIAGVASQLQHLPRTATHLVISAGGNDALQMSGVLDERATSVASAMEMLAVVGGLFGRSYSAMLEEALKPGSR